LTQPNKKNSSELDSFQQAWNDSHYCRPNAFITFITHVASVRTVLDCHGTVGTREIIWRTHAKTRSEIALAVVLRCTIALLAHSLVVG
jgi:hypothetical protein